jgi:hypothetical protein
VYSCPECEGEINQASEICPRCGADLASLAQTALAAEPAKPRSIPRLLFIWGMVLAVIGVGLYAFVWYVLPEYSTTDAPQQAEARGVEAVHAMQAALAAYFSSENRYPEALESLGAPAQAAAQSALGAGYTLQYAPGPLGSDGAARTFTLSARPARYGLRSYYTDQSGVLHATAENRAATSSDPPL